jgi:hypothetical protein
MPDVHADGRRHQQPEDAADYLLDAATMLMTPRHTVDGPVLIDEEKQRTPIQPLPAPQGIDLRGAAPPGAMARKRTIASARPNLPAAALGVEALRIRLPGTPSPSNRTRRGTRRGPRVWSRPGWGGGGRCAPRLPPSGSRLCALLRLRGLEQTPRGVYSESWPAAHLVP